MPVALPLDAADASALVQQFLLHHGARYTSRATEENWRLIPVSLQVPTTAGIPAGSWLVVPWQLASVEHLELWLQRLSEAGPLPQFAVLTMDTPILPASALRQLSGSTGVELVAVSAMPPGVYGSRTADVVAPMLEADTRRDMDDANPLAHLHALGDPRDPEVFVQRLRHAAPRTPVTRAVFWFNIVVFAVMVLTATDEQHRAANLLTTLLAGFEGHDLRTWGANGALFTTGAGAWRLLASAFVHGNLLHIVMNLMVLRQLGDTAERLFGSLAFACVYLLAALGGSIASLGWHAVTSPLAVSVGASGAVFGVMGATIGFALARRDAVPPTVYKALLNSGVFFTVVNVGLGLTLAVVDNACHLGGLLVGIAAGAVLSRDLPPAPQRPFAQVLALTASGLALLALLFRLVVAQIPQL